MATLVAALLLSRQGRHRNGRPLGGRVVVPTPGGPGERAHFVLLVKDGGHVAVAFSFATRSVIAQTALRFPMRDGWDRALVGGVASWARLRSRLQAAR